MVAAFFLLFGFLILSQSKLLEVNLPDWINKYSLWVIAGIFVVRAIGDFNYVGFFKKMRNTPFGQNDTRYYSPICLVIGILTIILEINK
jgi:hypothetical protein